MHECWHLVEDAFDAMRYRDMIRFRMALDRFLGLETLEHADIDTPRDAPERRAAALAEVREAVGDYATTAPHEGTAELFTASWLRTSGHRLVLEVRHTRGRLRAALDLIVGHRHGLGRMAIVLRP